MSVGTHGVRRDGNRAGPAYSRAAPTHRRAEPWEGGPGGHEGGSDHGHRRRGCLPRERSTAGGTRRQTPGDPMPGMSRGVQGGHSVVVTAFETTLRHQFLVVLLIGVAVMVVWNVARTSRRGRAVTAGPADTTGPGQPRAEPLARRVLRIGFGLLWVFDGFLQTQSSMPLGVAPGVLQPTASSSPSWVQHVVNVGVTLWGNHPVSAAAAAVWIPIGVGLLLLVAPRGRLSRFGGAIGVGWGLVVWVFGEAFGGVFGHGSSWAFGTPGAVVFYIVAGGLIALPERAWETPKLGRGIVSALGAFFLGMALLQAWPGRGFWQGHGHGAAVSGTLAVMVREMARTPQPGFLSSWVGSFASFDAAHGWGVNLF